MTSLEEKILNLIKASTHISFLNIVQNLSGIATQSEITSSCVNLQNLQKITSVIGAIIDPTLHPERIVYKIK